MTPRPFVSTGSRSPRAAFRVAIILALVTAAAFTATPAAAVIATFDVNRTFGDVSGCAFLPNDEVTVTIKASPAGPTQFTGNAATNGTGCFFLQGDETQVFPLNVGQYVSVTDGNITKELTLEPIEISLVNTDTDVISGTASPSEVIEVEVNNAEDDAFQSTSADGGGAWSVDFTGLHDVTGATHINAFAGDEDFDRTGVFREAPHLFVHVDVDSVGGCGFQPGNVNVRIRQAPAGTTLFNGPATAGADGCFFDLGPQTHGLDLKPGMEVAGTQLPAQQVLLIPNLAVTSLASGSDIAGGVAPPNAEVLVGAFGPSGGGELTVTANGSGNWSADFTGTADIEAQTFVNAETQDDDGDLTHALRVSPWIDAVLTFNDVTGCGIDSPGNLVVRSAPGGQILFNGPFQTDGIGCFFAEELLHGVDLKPGMFVRVTSGSIVRELTLVPVTINAFNAATGTSSGTATPGATVLAGFSLPNRGDGHEVTANGAGNWSFSFGEPIDGGGDNVVWEATIRDAQGDGTQYRVVPGCTVTGSTLRIGVGPGAYSVRRAGSDFQVSGPQVFDPDCGGGTMTSIDRVEVMGGAGAQSVTIDLDGGDFVPGKTAEGAGTSEIEFRADVGAGDAIVVNAGGGSDVVRAGVSGVDVNNDQDPDVTAVLGPVLGALTLLGGTGSDVLAANGGFGTGAAYPAAVTIDGGDHPDVVTGGPNPDVLGGGAGGGTDRLVETRDGPMILTNASLAAGGATDVLSSFEAATLTGGATGNLLDASGFSGAVTLSGLGGADTLRGGPLADTLLGGDGTDTLTGGGGANTIDGGTGSDRVLETANENMTLTNTTLKIGSPTSSLVAVETATLTGGNGNNVLDASGFTGAVVLSGGAGNDTLTGGTAGDQLFGGTGNDVLIGRQGNNQLNGESGSDTVPYVWAPGGVNASLTGSATGPGFADSLIQMEHLAGSAFNDVLRGNNLANQVSGGSGSDSIDVRDGVRGNDVAAGEAGSDSCLADPNDQKVACES